MNVIAYESFLASKTFEDVATGIKVPLQALATSLFDFQKCLVQWALRRGRASIFTGTGCVAPGTIIDMPGGGERIDRLARRGKAIRVYSLNRYAATIVANAEAPFCKGVAPLYTITLHSGRSITVTKHHRLLTPIGWQCVSGLHAGSRIVVSSQWYPGRMGHALHVSSGMHSSSASSPRMLIGPVSEHCVCADGHLASIPESSPSKLCGDVRHYAQSIQGFQSHCAACHHQCDAQPLSLLDTCQGAFPSQACALAHNHAEMHADVMVSKRAHSHLGQSCDHHAMPDLMLQDCYRQDAAESRASSLHSLSQPLRRPISQLSDACAIPAQSGSVSYRYRQGLAACQGEPYAFLDEIVEILHTDTGVYYDLHVPVYENYLAQGIWNHNTGKTRMQLAWARHIPGRVLILAPLAVTQQTIREAERMDMEPVQYVRAPTEIRQRICITNYDMAEHFIGTDLAGMILDEASIVKSFSGATRKMLVNEFAYMPYRLCCTATPAPNSTEEIGNYAEWLGVMTLNSMRATFFVHDDEGWRLMPHAREAFYRWLASWAMTMRGPADLGFDSSGFDLPPLNIIEHFLPWDDTRLIANGDGQMGIPGLHKLHGIADRLAVRQQTISLRSAHAARLAIEAGGQSVIWCGLNDESSEIMRCLDGHGAIEIRGSDIREEKERKFIAFLGGDHKILVSKIQICGFGVNMQCATTAIFAGMNDSWEGYYQAIRRLWRYGQQHAVTIHVVLSEQERPVWDNVQHKEQEAMTMIDGLIEQSKSYQHDALFGTTQHDTGSGITTHQGDGWTLHHGDCIEGLRLINDESLGLIIYSPPFSNLFQYNASERDLGNCHSSEQFFAHHTFVADELKRCLMPGRLIAMHVMQVPAMLVRDGWIGLHDFRGQMIAHMQGQGFIYAGEVTCAKSPQAQAIRIRAKGLAFNQLHKDSAWSRPCLNDYILLFRKSGENVIPVKTDLDNNTWIIWASGIWVSTYYDTDDGYRETYTLNVAEGRDPDDTKHICPLPLDLVERCVRLWSNPGETILDPFSGLGTVGVKALEHGREYIGCELKESYVRAQMLNLERASRRQSQQTLFG